MDNLSMEVSYWLNTAANDVRRAMDRAFQGTGLTDLQWIILRVTRDMSERREPNPTIDQVADRIARDPDAVRRETLRLEQRGLVRVQPHGAPLSATVALTARGENQLPALTTAAGAVADQAVNGLTNDELSSLTSLLRRVAGNLE